MADLTPTHKPKSTAYAGEVVTWVAANNADQEIAWDDNLELLARNTGVTSRTITIYSIDDPTGRARDISVTLASGATKRFTNLKAILFKQANGKLKVKATHAEVVWAILTDTPA